VHFSSSEGHVFIADGLKLIWNKVHDVITNYICLEDFLFCVLDKNASGLNVCRWQKFCVPFLFITMWHVYHYGSWFI